MSRFGLGRSVEEAILEAGEIGFLCWRKGWAEGAAGNLSVAVDHPVSQGAERKALASPLPGLAGQAFLISASGARLRDFAKRPEHCLGIIRIVDGGQSYVEEWGFLGGAKATSELPAHMAVHERRQRIGRPIRALLHAHATNLIALSFAPRFRRDPELLMGVLYRMHTEAYQGLPKGIAFIGFRVPGGSELADDAAAALCKSDLALWSHHGVIATGDSLSGGMDLLEYGDKAAQLFLMASQRNDGGAYLSAQDLRDLKTAYHAARAAKDQ